MAWDRSLLWVGLREAEKSQRVARKTALNRSCWGVTENLFHELENNAIIRWRYQAGPFPALTSDNFDAWIALDRLPQLCITACKSSGNCSVGNMGVAPGISHRHKCLSLQSVTKVWHQPSKLGIGLIIRCLKSVIPCLTIYYRNTMCAFTNVLTKIILRWV